MPKLRLTDWTDWPKAAPPTATEIVQCAEATGFPKTPIWHARVAQALSLHDYDEEAVGHYLLSLEKGAEPSWVVHAGAARAFSELKRHNEALYHTSRSNEARKLQEISVKTSLEEVGSLLGTAVAEEAAGLSRQAVQSARQAWLLCDKNHVKKQLLLTFLRIFAKNGRREETMWVIRFIEAHDYWRQMQAVAYSPTFYSAFCLCPEIEDKAIKVWDQTIAEDLTEALKSLPNMAAEILFYAGLFFLRNWQTAKAINTWELVLSSLPPDIEFSNFDYSEQLNELKSLVRTRLVTFFLKVPGSCRLGKSGPVESQPQTINTDSYLSGSPKEDILRLTLEEPVGSDANIVIMSWYHLRGQGDKARHLLRGRIRACIELLSDDDPSNDIDAYVMLLTTFLATGKDDANIAGALYLMKAWKYQLNPSESGELDKRRDEEPNTGSQPEKIAADTKNKSSGVDDAAYSLTKAAIGQPDPDFQSYDIIQECEGCQITRHTWSGWHFCRFCPMVRLCTDCFNLRQAGAWKKQICDPSHEFFFTGNPLRPEEIVPKGKLPVGDEVIWIEEWKGRLEEEWRTAEFTERKHWALLRDLVHGIDTLENIEVV
jgi:hypothetical protein